MRITSYQHFKQLVQSHSKPVILLEGRRAIPADDKKAAEQIGKWLAEELPNAIFRSGNAEGSDEAFSRGVAAVDPSRLEIVVPYGSHRKKYRIPGSKAVALEDTSDVTQNLVREATVSATPNTKNLVKDGTSSRLAAKGRYLLRDSLKVFGDPGKLEPALVALFYVDPDDEMLGGTGHTLRVAQEAGIAYCTQASWLQWYQDSH